MKAARQNSNSAAIGVTCQVYAGLGSKLGGEVIEMASVEDLSMAGPGSTLPMRIYRPLKTLVKMEL